MANTYSQIYIQVVFAVQGRSNLIQKQNKEELHKYMTGIVRERGQKLLAVHCMPDHSHMLVGLKPSMALSDLVRDVKNGSTNFINRSGWIMGRFCWQEGFGAFSYGHSQLKGIMTYMLYRRAGTPSYPKEFPGRISAISQEVRNRARGGNTFLSRWIEGGAGHPYGVWHAF